MMTRSTRLSSGWASPTCCTPSIETRRMPVVHVTAKFSAAVDRAARGACASPVCRNAVPSSAAALSTVRARRSRARTVLRRLSSTRKVVIYAHGARTP
eukprot:scaffold61249_cov64-Phaeocystis_antarctica.AAC.6